MAAGVLVLGSVSAVAQQDFFNEMAEPSGDILVLRGLDKIAARVTELEVPVGESVEYGNLVITARYCRSSPPTEPPETKAFMEIDDIPPGEEAERIFSGWMFASTPAVSALEHPVYDVWVLNCRTMPGEAELDSE